MRANNNRRVTTDRLSQGLAADSNRNRPNDVFQLEQLGDILRDMAKLKQLI